jgi:hypothetical protein
MGTINYHTSDYITLAIEPYEMGEDEENFAYDYYDDDRMNIVSVLDKYDFEYYRLTLENGYYEGFSLNIEALHDEECLEDSYEKKAILKELTQVKRCLLELAGIGMVECFPSWCTAYRDYKQTVKSIRDTIASMKHDIENMPTKHNVMTYAQWCIEQGEFFKRWSAK